MVMLKPCWTAEQRMVNLLTGRFMSESETPEWPEQNLWALVAIAGTAYTDKDCDVSALGCAILTVLSSCHVNENYGPTWTPTFQRESPLLAGQQLLGGYWREGLCLFTSRVLRIWRDFTRPVLT